MRTRMYLDIHIISAPSMPTQGPTWYSCFFFERKRGDEGESGEFYKIVLELNS